MNFVDPGVFGQINLPPTLRLPQLADSTAKFDADVCCHTDIFGLVFRLDLAHTLSRERFIGARIGSCVLSLIPKGVFSD